MSVQHLETILSNASQYRSQALKLLVEQPGSPTVKLKCSGSQENDMFRAQMNEYASILAPAPPAQSATAVNEVDGLKSMTFMLGMQVGTFKCVLASLQLCMHRLAPSRL
jgi:hypothetical protein